jgi:uncharacterized Rmd1/YagE family protein
MFVLCGCGYGGPALSDGKIDLTQKQITMEIGRLFIERNSVNLHFDILDTPEFFWEQDKYKPVYDRLAGYLELGKRVDILNKRLDIMKGCCVVRCCALVCCAALHLSAHIHFSVWLAACRAV